MSSLLAVVLLAFEEQVTEDGASTPASPTAMNSPILLEFFSNDWPIQSYSEVRRYTESSSTTRT